MIATIALVLQVSVLFHWFALSLKQVRITREFQLMTLALTYCDVNNLDLWRDASYRFLKRKYGYFAGFQRMQDSIDFYKSLGIKLADLPPKFTVVQGGKDIQ